MYIVLDEKGIGYSDGGQTVILPKGATLDESLIEKNYFRLSGIESLIKDGRLKRTGGSEKVIAPANMKMPEVEVKIDKKSPKGSKKK